MRRYGEHGAGLQPLMASFGLAELRAWAEALGIETFVGSSGLVFPKDMKAAPLLRAWLQRHARRACSFRYAIAGWAGPKTAR